MNATEHLDRRGLQATRIDEIGPEHKHCFSFIARHPHAWQLVPPRKSDLVFRPSQTPETITVAGFVGSTSNLKQTALAGNPCAITVEQEDGTLVPTVVARFETDAPSYYLWLELHADRPFGSGDEPGLILYAFDPYRAADRAAATEMVGVWSVPVAEVAA